MTKCPSCRCKAALSTLWCTGWPETDQSASRPASTRRLPPRASAAGHADAGSAWMTAVCVVHHGSLSLPLPVVTTGPTTRPAGCRRIRRSRDDRRGNDAPLFASERGAQIQVEGAAVSDRGGAQFQVSLRKSRSPLGLYTPTPFQVTNTPRSTFSMINSDRQAAR